MWSSSSSEDEGETKETRAPSASHFDRAKLNVPLAEKEVSFDEENETPLIPSWEEEASEKPVIARSKAAKRNIVMLSSDEEEEEVKTHNTSPWTEEEDRMLRWLLENYEGIVDPWGMVAYDSFFLKARRSQRNVMQRAIELGLLDANTELPEESEEEVKGGESEEEEKKEEEKEEKEREKEEEEKEEKEREKEEEEKEEDNTEDPARLERDSQSSEERAALIRTNLANLMKRIPQANKLSVLSQFV